MLILGRKKNESIILEIPGIDPIKITMFEDDKIGFDAPEEVQILREELLNDTTD